MIRQTLETAADEAMGDADLAGEDRNVGLDDVLGLNHDGFEHQMNLTVPAIHLTWAVAAP